LRAAHKALREGTAEAHDRVDAAFAGFDLRDREDYARFLRGHAEVVWPLEAAVPGERITPDWEARKRGHLLHEDLAFLRHPSESWDLAPLSAAPAAQDPSLRWDDRDDAAVAGALYVLEGSRLGGRFLARQLPPDLPRAYLDADQPAEKWRNLLDRFDTILYEPARLQSALAAAHEVFAAFERSATRWAKG
jgi:heme oxygenase